MLMGHRDGLVMSPMSTAAMNSVDRTKAGAASGVLSMSRMVGGTFGVAVMGALIATIGRSKIDHSLPQLPAAHPRRARQLARRGRRLSGHGLPAQVIARRPRGVRVGAGHRPGDQRRGDALRARSLAWILIEPRPKATEPEQAEPGDRPQRRDRRPSSPPSDASRAAVEPASPTRRARSLRRRPGTTPVGKPSAISER